MWHFKLDRGQSVETSHVMTSLFMGGFVASTAFIASTRLLAPWMGLTVCDPISIALNSLQSYELIIAEVIFFLGVTIILPLVYAMVWRPLASPMLETYNWLMHSTGFGMVLAGFVTMAVKLFGGNASTGFDTLWPLAINILFACLTLGGMIRLRELDQMEV